ncbi:UNVERIFIED_CONTAM: hypothetical protein Sradi_3368100 [Sesamum radiatum]|uniref:Uncharacterized protein n=1 Tax=Sesamum radiatum TaxID=300843 RepID=A0AAW2R3R5_SESRA
MLESSTSLVYLMVSNCPQLTSFPVDFERMPHLYYLEISQCKNLSKIFPRVGSNCLCHLTHLTLDAWANHGSFEDFCRDFQGLLSLRSLEDLTLHGNRNWSSLPSQLQHLTALTRLSLSYFGVEELPEWFGNFSYLRTLSLHDMEFLRRLPRTMERLTELDDLYVNECEKLSRLWKGKYSYDGIYADPDFPMFSQVLCVHVNGHVAIVLDPEKRQAYTDEY